MRRMSGLYNIIEHIFIGLRPFGLKCISICYINYSRKLPEVFISLTSSYIDADALMEELKS